MKVEYSGLKLDAMIVREGAHVSGETDVANPAHWQGGVCPRDGDTIVFPDARPIVMCRGGIGPSEDDSHGRQGAATDTDGDT